MKIFNGKRRLDFQTNDDDKHDLREGINREKKCEFGLGPKFGKESWVKSKHKCVFFVVDFGGPPALPCGPSAHADHYLKFSFPW